MIANAPDQRLLRLATNVVSAHISHNALPAEELRSVIEAVYGAFNGLGSEAPAAVVPEPAVPIKKSVFPDYIVCLEDGKQLKMLKRHLMTSYGMRPEEYRTRWGLPDGYPMVAPNYAATRSSLAKKTGLGRKAEPLPPVEVPVQQIPAGISGKRRSRQKRTTI